MAGQEIQKSRGVLRARPVVKGEIEGGIGHPFLPPQLMPEFVPCGRQERITSRCYTPQEKDGNQHAAFLLLCQK